MTIADQWAAYCAAHPSPLHAQVAWLPVQRDYLAGFFAELEQQRPPVPEGADPWKAVMDWVGAPGWLMAEYRRVMRLMDLVDQARAADAARHHEDYKTLNAALVAADATCQRLQWRVDALEAAMNPQDVADIDARLAKD